MIDSVESLIQANEGLRLQPYRDQFGNWTVGYRSEEHTSELQSH